MIDRIQTWLDAHPRARFTGRLSWTTVVTLIYAVVIATVSGFLGALVGAAIILIVNLAGPLSYTSLDDVWGSWMVFLSLSAIVGALVGLGWNLMRMLRTDTKEHRTRATVARDLVTQAVVADQVGFEDLDLQLGIFEGGTVEWTYSVRLNDGKSTTDVWFDHLTVQLANPSLTGDNFIGWDQRRAWFAEITRIVDEIIIHRAAEGIDTVDAASLTAAAAQRARGILAETDNAAREAIETELRAAGRMRGERFQTLLGRTYLSGPSRASKLSQSI